MGLHSESDDDGGGAWPAALPQPPPTIDTRAGHREILWKTRTSPEEKCFQPFRCVSVHPFRRPCSRRRTSPECQMLWFLPTASSLIKTVDRHGEHPEENVVRKDRQHAGRHDPFSGRRTACATVGLVPRKQELDIILGASIPTDSENCRPSPEPPGRSIRDSIQIVRQCVPLRGALRRMIQSLPGKVQKRIEVVAGGNHSGRQRRHN
jgi:hypothetical protein